MNNHFADIILPLAVKGIFTYRIPDEMAGKVVTGSRVLVQFGNKNLYSGIVASISENSPSAGNVRDIVRILDPEPAVNSLQLKLWSWIADYYMCDLGEVLKAALPSAMFLEGEKSAPPAEKYKPKTETFVELASAFTDIELHSMLDKLSKAGKQYEVLNSLLRLTGYSEGTDIRPVRKLLLLKDSKSSDAAV